MMLAGMRVIESVHLTEPGHAWFPAGRSGWKVKRAVRVPMNGAVKLNETTLLIHPATLRRLKETEALKGSVEFETTYRAGAVPR